MSESESSQEVTETSMHRAETNVRSRLATLINSFTFLVGNNYICYLLVVLSIIFFDGVGVVKFEEFVVFVYVEVFISGIEYVDAAAFGISLYLFCSWSVVGDDQAIAEFDGKFAHRHVIHGLVLYLDEVGLEHAFALHGAVEIARQVALEAVVEHGKYNLHTTEAGIFGKGLLDVDGRNGREPSLAIDHIGFPA